MAHARIGKVRAKDANVIGLRGSLPLRCDRKDQFVQNLSQSFDSYVRKYGEEPDAVVSVLGGLKQTAEAYWCVRSDSEGGGTTMLAVAQATLTREIGS